MRIAVVSPYSWTYPGGVNRHVDGLRAQLDARGHEVRVFAPFDADGRRTALLHRGARPQPLAAPEWLEPIGGTAGWAFNGAVSNLALHPAGVVRLRRSLRAFAPDIVHLHEPVAPWPCWDTLAAGDVALVGTFHTYGTNALTHGAAALAGSRRRMNRLRVRIAVSEAAAWTGRRFYGGDYRVIPNGVALPAGGVPVAGLRPPCAPLRLVFVGQAVARKGLPVLLRAFEAVRAEVPATLTLVGPSCSDVAPLLDDLSGVTALGRVDDERKHAELAAADVLVAPSLGGESFGIVLAEAFAAGTPVVASDIPGYREVVRTGSDGLLVPPGDPERLAVALREAAYGPEALERASRAAAVSAHRYAWATVAEAVEGSYEHALALPARHGAAARLGLRPVSGGPRVPAQRLAPLEPAAARSRNRLRRALAAAAAVPALAGAAWGLHHIGPEAVARSLVRSSPTWVLAALAVMAASMVLRAVSWRAFLHGALPDARARFSDAWQGTAIGVLMSATLPARLGEPARAMIVARRLGRARERLPAVVGTLVGQTLVNVLALLVLGAVVIDGAGLFRDHGHVLLWCALGPLAVVGAVLVAPAVLAPASRSARLAHVRSGLAALRRPRTAATAVGAQLGAWALQWLSCYLLLVALGLEHRAGAGAAAAVLFAVNVSAVLPVTPSNLGVFQAACVAVLAGAYGVRAGDALGYGIVLQGVELTTAIVMGAPALVREGLSWRDVRLRTLHAAPVRLAPRRPAALDDAR